MPPLVKKSSLIGHTPDASLISVVHVDWHGKLLRVACVEDLDCAATSRAALVAPKRRRKDALVPMCSGDKEYRCWQRA